MAIDTANKRMSCIGIALPAPQCFAVPDGAVDDGDAQSVALCYSGILAAGPLEAVTHRRHGFLESIERGGI